MNCSSVIFLTSSKWAALVLMYMKKHMYTLPSASPFRTLRAQVKSTPVTLKGGSSHNLSVDRGERWYF